MINYAGEKTLYEKEEVDSLLKDISEEYAMIAELEERVAALEGQLAALAERMADAEAAIKEIKEYIGGEGEGEGGPGEYKGEYAVVDAVRQEIQDMYLSNPSSFGLSYGLSLESMTLCFNDWATLGCKVGYGYSDAHYPRDYTVDVSGTYEASDNGDGTFTIVPAFTWDSAAVSGAYTGGHNDIGACDGDDSMKHAAGEAVGFDEGSAGAALGLAIGKAIAEKYFGGGLTWSADKLYSGEAEIAAKRGD